MNKLSIVLVFVGMCIACHTTNKINSSSDQVSVPELEFRKGACFGHCPVYHVSIYEGGHYIYEAKRFGDQVGIFSGKLDKDQWNSIQSQASQMEWNNYQEYYESQIPDLPSTTLVYQGKKVTFKENGPEELAEWAKSLHDIFGSMKLTHPIYSPSVDYINIEAIHFSLENNCALDYNFQMKWKDKMSKIKPLSSEGLDYRMEINRENISYGQAYYLLSQDPCIDKISWHEKN